MKAEIKEMGLHGGDLQSFDVYGGSNANQNEICYKNDHHNHPSSGVANGGDVGTLADVDMDISDPSSLFYVDDFPPLPDFPCMSSSSSSSSAPALVPATDKKFASTATSSSASTASSGAASWGAEHEVGAPPQASETVGSMSTAVDDVDQCMDMMESFGCIDLLESVDICWDPSPLFEENSHNHNHDYNNDHDYSANQLLRQEQLEQERQEEERAFEEFMWNGESPSIGVDFSLNNDETANKTDHQQQKEQQHQQEELPSPSDDLAMVFFEWLKTNKETISAEDLRNIKIKKSTIESAAKRLGGGKEGMKQLLKLILQWVQNHHLQNKRLMMRDSSNSFCGSLMVDPTNSGNINGNNNQPILADPGGDMMHSGSNPNPSPRLAVFDQPTNTATPCYGPPAPGTWLPASPFVGDPATVVPPPGAGFAPMVGYMGPNPYSTGAAYPPMDYSQMVDVAPSTWAPHQFGVGPHYSPFTDPTHAVQFGGYGNPSYRGFYNHLGPGDGLVRLGSSATKEARKKRMARQRKFVSHHHRSSHHHHHQTQNQNNQQNQTAEQHAGVGIGNWGPTTGHGNWVYWAAHQPSPLPPSLPLPAQVNQSIGGLGPVVGEVQPLERQSNNGYQRQLGVDKKQGWKSEKNLRFLLQKVLKQSDVGNLGRIVLPKKEAETHLPELEARDGIPIAMEDIGTSRVWNMRYRFWPNNKSRMYLLENTGDFVRSNELQEGDFIVIYSDAKYGKYMIRGVKVRPQQGAKPETTNKKPSKSQKTYGSSTPSGQSGPSSPSNTMQK